MKRKSILLFSALLSCIVFCKAQQKLYYDIEGKGTDSSNAAYYRLASLDTAGIPKDTVKDYYITGELQGKGLAIKIDKKEDSASKWKGAVIRYYRSGAVKARHNFNKHGKPDSLNVSYYESGKVHREATYKNGIVVGKFIKEWDEFGYGEKIFHDHFRDGNGYNWPLNKNERHICKIVKDSGLEMVNIAGDKPLAQAINLPLDQDKLYSVETVVDFKNGDDTLWHGLIWGFKDWDNYHFFLITSSGYYRGGTVLEGIVSNLALPEYTDLIRKGSSENVLKILLRSRKMIYTINGHIVARVQRYPLSGNYIGFLLRKGKQQVLFENLVVKQNLDEGETDPDSSGVSQNPNNEPGNPNGNEFKGWHGVGSGFFIDPSGYIATTYNVIAKATQIQVDVLQGGDRVFLKAKVVSFDKQNDLAVLKITDSAFKPSTSLPYNLKTETGDVATSIFTLGFPQADILGTEVKFTDGKISAKTGFKGTPTWYQITVPLQAGNSGGPLFDYDGNIIGIVVNARIRADQNVNYAIKSSYLKSFLESLPEKFNLPHDTSLAPKALTEKIKVLTDYVVMIKVK